MSLFRSLMRDLISLISINDAVPVAPSPSMI
jgi:hypothetical protein